jgi:DegV family protein with EDD domain
VNVGIVTDSNCDLPLEQIEKFGIEVVPLYINIGTDSYLDGIEMSRAEFYEGLPIFATHPTTAVPGEVVFLKAYERLASRGAKAILSIHISESLSGIVDVARQSAKRFKAVPVSVFDSGNLTLGTGLQVLAAARAAAEGSSVPEIIAMLQDQRRRTYCFAGLDTLEFLRRSGRLSRFQWGLGSILRLKPILKMHDGQAEMERVRTRSRSLERVVELATELGPLEEIALVHTHAPEEAEALRQRASHLFPAGEDPMRAEVTPVIGSHIGPGAVGVVCIQAGR